jgi:uncharacterized RDD family membrane protein YckC
MQQTETSSIFEQMEAEQPFFVYATNGQRFANMLIDSILCWSLYLGVIFVIAFTMATTGSTHDEITSFAENSLLLVAISLSVNAAYYILVEKFTKGRTLGKLITGTQAVKEDLSAISWKEAFIRTVTRFIPFEPFSALGNHPWHDRWSKTIVIKKRQHIV